MKSLAIDLGAKRVGVAISDAEGRFAVPLTTLDRRDDEQLARAIGELARQEEVERLVAGEPLRLDGSPGPAALRARRFAERLARDLGLPLELVDEVLTSREAEERLRAAGVDPRRHPERVDAVAAQIILQEALDRDARDRNADSECADTRSELAPDPAS